MKPIRKNPIDKINKPSKLKKFKSKSLLIIKKIKELNTPKRILKPPILGLGFLLCFLKSVKSRRFLFKAKVVIKGKEIKEIKSDIKNVRTKLNKSKMFGKR